MGFSHISQAHNLHNIPFKYPNHSIVTRSLGPRRNEISQGALKEKSDIKRSESNNHKLIPNMFQMLQNKEED